MNASTMSRTEAGDRLHELAVELSEEKGLTYEAAFNKVCKQEPELVKIYIPASRRVGE